MKKIFRKILGLIFPNRCLTCNDFIDESGLFCLEDFKKLTFITDPKCKICCRPFRFIIDKKTQSICENCLSEKPHYDSSLAIFSYNETIAKAILRLKYNDDIFLGKKFAKLLSARLKNEIENYDLIVAIPLHKKRLKTRKFNQSAILCKEISRNFGHLKFYPNLLLRNKFEKSQANLSPQQRQKNLENSFQINPKFRTKIKGKNILLVDDVVTTGATAGNCAKILKNFGCGNVKIAAIARTVFKEKENF